MKNIIIFASFILFLAKGYGQDVGITGSVTPNPITVGNTGTLQVIFNNNCFCTIMPGNVYVEVSFAPVPAVYTVSAPGGPGASLFNWTFDGVTYTGTNNSIIPLLSASNITFTLTGVGPGMPPAIVMFTDLNVGSDPNFPNNNATAGFTVAVPMPITLSSFTGTSVDCDHVSLQWKTSSERNNDYMEILRSSDGKEYLSIGKISGENKADGSTYGLDDHNYLLPNGKYYYKLRQVDFDGRMTHHEVIAVDHTCKDVPFGIDVYPNPATDKIHIALTGFGEDTEVKLQIVNNEGSLLRSISVNTSSVQDVSLDDLQAGIYQIQSTNLDKPLSARFIKIQ